MVERVVRTVSMGESSGRVKPSPEEVQRGVLSWVSLTEMSRVADTHFSVPDPDPISSHASTSSSLLSTKHPLNAQLYFQLDPVENFSNVRKKVAKFFKRPCKNLQKTWIKNFKTLQSSASFSIFYPCFL